MVPVYSVTLALLLVCSILDMEAGVFSAETEEEFLSFERDYTGVVQSQSQHATEPDLEDCDEDLESEHSLEEADFGSDP